MAIMSWSLNGRRNISLCADNRDVLSWAERASTLTPSASRILRDAAHFPIVRGVGILLGYVRSEHRIFADFLDRWSVGNPDLWETQENKPRIDATTHLWAGMALSYDPNLGLAPPYKLAILGRVFTSFDAITIGFSTGAQVIFRGGCDGELRNIRFR